MKLSGIVVAFLVFCLGCFLLVERTHDTQVREDLTKVKAELKLEKKQAISKLALSEEKSKKDKERILNVLNAYYPEDSEKLEQVFYPKKAD
jgi:hypothetical protein